MAVKMMRGRSQFLFRDKAGKEHFRAEIIADTAAELTGAEVIEDIVCEMGSVAYAVQDALFLVIDSEGTWYSSTEDPDSETTGTLSTASTAKASLSNTKLTVGDTDLSAQTLDTPESEVTTNDLMVGSTESE